MCSMYKSRNAFLALQPSIFLAHWSRYVLHTICAHIWSTPFAQHQSIPNTDERSKLVYYENKLLEQIKTNCKNKNEILTFCISYITVSLLPSPRSSTFISHCRNYVQFLLFSLSITPHVIGNIYSSTSLPTTTNS